MAKIDSTTGKISYSSADYDAILADVKSKISSLSNSWTDYSDSDLGIVLVQLFAGIGDMLGYYLNTQATETMLKTATIRKNVIELVEQIYYRLKRPIGSVTSVKLAPLESEVATRDYVIPKYTVVSTGGGTEFITTELATLKKGARFVEVRVIQGELMVDEFTAVGGEHQIYELTGDRVAENFLDVYVGESLWFEDKKDEFAEYRRNIYTAEMDYLNKTSIEFDREIGDTPGKGTTIRAVYANTSADAGNIPAQSIVHIDTDFDGADELYVINEDGAVNGRDKETIKEAKRNAPRSLRAGGRAVTKEDFEYLATQQTGIAKAVAKNGSKYWKEVHLYVAPSGGGILGNSAKEELLEYFSKRMEICTDLRILDPVYVPVDIEIHVNVRPNYRQSDTIANIRAIGEEYFKFENQKFGGGLEVLNTFDKLVDDDDTGIQLGDLYELMEVQEGVRFIEVRKLLRRGEEYKGAKSAEFSDIEIPILGDFVITAEGGV